MPCTEARFPAILFALVAALFGSRSAAAQHRFSVSVDAGSTFAVGAGSTFRQRSLHGPYFAASVDRELTRRVDIFAKFETTSLGPRTGQSTACLISNNPCVLPFPEMHGWNYVIGPGFRPANWVVMRGGIGIAKYYTSDDVWLGTLATTALGDIAVFPVNHLGLAATFGWVDLPRYPSFGASLSLKSLSLSLRIRGSGA